MHKNTFIQYTKYPRTMIQPKQSEKKAPNFGFFHLFEHFHQIFLYNAL